MAKVDLFIQNGNKIYYPTIEEGITWDTERKGSPGKLSFTAIPDNILSFTEGNQVGLKVDNNKVFYGFVFSKKEDKDKKITATAYDQLRYFKNKDTYYYKNKRADQVVRLLANDFNLNVGTLENTGHVIASRVEENKTLFDIVQTAIELTIQYKKNMYVLYDDYGKLMFKNIGNMKVGLLIDEETGENFDYTSSIDGETYNKIKLSRDNEETGKKDIYIAQDSSHINEWGVLQYFDTIDGNVNGKAKANALLSLYNKKTKNLTIKDAIGDIRVRAGVMVAVKLKLNDITIQNFMLVEKAKHTFKNGYHTMDLTLRGNGFSV